MARASDGMATPGLRGEAAQVQQPAKLAGLDLTAEPLVLFKAPAATRQNSRLIERALFRAWVAENGRELRLSYIAVHPPSRAYWEAANAWWARIQADLGARR